MAITPTRTPFLQQGAGIGGGTPPTSVALDPTGLVPINRTQPLATDGFEPQRLMENRLGTMPPSSFSGAGAGFVPLDRAAPAAPIGNLAEHRTDYGNAVVPTGQPAQVTAQGAQRLATANRLGTPGVTNIAAQATANRNPRAAAAIAAARARTAQPAPARAGVNPDRMARLREALARGTSRATGLLGRIGG